MGRHRKDLRIAFRYFALATASSVVVDYLAASGGDPGASGENLGASGGDLGASGGTKPSGDEIDLPQFIAFAEAANLIDGRVKVCDCERVYATATKANELVAQAFSAERKLAAKLGREATHARGASMQQHQFVAAVVRIAAIKYKGPLPPRAESGFRARVSVWVLSLTPTLNPYLYA